jgi:hypothetical protein
MWIIANGRFFEFEKLALSRHPFNHIHRLSACSGRVREIAESAVRH